MKEVNERVSNNIFAINMSQITQHDYKRHVLLSKYSDRPICEQI